MGDKRDDKVPSWAEIRAMFAETGKQLKDVAKRQKQTDVLLKDVAERQKQTDELLKDVAERQKQTDELLKDLAERQKQTDEQMKQTDEQMKRTDEQLKRTDELLGGLGNNAGFHAEQFFQDALTQTLTFGGEKYDQLYLNLGPRNKKNCVEFDIVLANGKSVAIIETKNRIHPEDVEKLVAKKTTQFREFFPYYKNHKLYLGIAGFSFSKAIPEKAQKYGVGIIRQVGESIEMGTGHLKAY
ncbi:MAG: hypothetical protein LBC70_04040 [Chitinispirillales bacterium]|jgi:hypothetical protein|nr:hypothetical protein [Chitinispirillales bacterium]